MSSQPRRRPEEIPLTPVILEPDPERTRRLDSASRSAEFFAAHREDYRGKFVVICDGRFIAASIDPQEAKREAAKHVDLRKAVIEYVPIDDDAYFY